MRQWALSRWAPADQTWGPLWTGWGGEADPQWTPQRDARLHKQHSRDTSPRFVIPPSQPLSPPHSQSRSPQCATRTSERGCLPPRPAFQAQPQPSIWHSYSHRRAALTWALFPVAPRKKLKKRHLLKSRERNNRYVCCVFWRAALFHKFKLFPGTPPLPSINGIASGAVNNCLAAWPGTLDSICKSEPLSGWGGVWGRRMWQKCWGSFVWSCLGVKMDFILHLKSQVGFWSSALVAKVLLGHRWTLKTIDVMISLFRCNHWWSINLLTKV